MKKRTILYYSLLFLAIVVIDLGSKQWAVKHCLSTMPITSWLSFALTYNRGISWSLFHSDNELVFYLLTLIITTIIIFLTLYTYQRFKRHEPISAEIIVLAGAISNLIDRCLHHAVIDFIVLHYQDFYWPLFNGADVAIVIGALGMLFNDFISQK